MEKEIERYIEIWKRCFEEQENYIDHIRGVKHDMEAHMIVLQYYLNTENYVEAKQYLQLIRNQQDYEKPVQFLNFGNKLVEAIVQEQVKKSNENIMLSCEGEFPKEMMVSDFDMCTIFSNLMSNAIEACGRLKVSKKVIKIKMVSEEGNFRLSVENPIEWEVDKRILGEGTTKEDKAAHGYGIKNIKKVISAYEGELNFVVTNTNFSINILLPDVVKSEV